MSTSNVAEGERVAQGEARVTAVKAAGVTIPAIGLGTWQLRGETCAVMVAEALRLGYTHVDTAQGYSNEDAVGDGLAASGVHAGDPEERELLWAAAILHDIGVAVDYDDHHKHSRYLVLSAGLPGYSPRETALIAQMCRYHRKGSPGLDDLAELGKRGDEALLARCATALRVAEQLERSRDQAVDGLRVEVDGDTAHVELEAHADVRVARWAAQRQRDIFQEAFGLELELSVERRERPAVPR